MPIYSAWVRVHFPLLYCALCVYFRPPIPFGRLLIRSLLLAAGHHPAPPGTRVVRRGEQGRRRGAGVLGGHPWIRPRECQVGGALMLVIDGLCVLMSRGSPCRCSFSEVSHQSSVSKDEWESSLEQVLSCLSPFLAPRNSFNSTSLSARWWTCSRSCARYPTGAVRL